MSPTSSCSEAADRGRASTRSGRSARPDRYEAGTPTYPGIVGLGAAAAKWLREHGDEQREHEGDAHESALAGVSAIPGYRILGPGPDEPRVPVVSWFTSTRRPISSRSRSTEGMELLCVLGCIAHLGHIRSLGTLETGALRLSVGFGLTEADVDLVVEALDVLGKEFTRP